MSTGENTDHKLISYKMIWSFTAALLIPLLGSLFGLTVLGKGAIDKIDGFGVRLDKFEVKLDRVSDRQDTIYNRQERYNINTTNEINILKKYPNPSWATFTSDPQTHKYTAHPTTN